MKSSKQNSPIKPQCHCGGPLEIKSIKDKLWPYFSPNKKRLNIKIPDHIREYFVTGCTDCDEMFLTMEDGKVIDEILNESYDHMIKGPLKKKMQDTFGKKK